MSACLYGKGRVGDVTNDLACLFQINGLGPGLPVDGAEDPYRLSYDRAFNLRLFADND